MKPDMSKSKTMGDISSPCSAFMITPTTLKSITQIFESEECLKSMQTYEATGDVVKAATASEIEKKYQLLPVTLPSSTLITRSGNTYFNLDSKSWQVGYPLIIYYD